MKYSFKEKMSNNKSPLVSVIIPTYNREKAVVRAVQSVLNQTFQDFEIIVIDDCSKDQTESAIRKIGDPRIQLIKHERNQGGSVARNTGVHASRGEFIAFLDSDDEWLSHKLEYQLTLLRQSTKSLGVVYSGFYYVDSENVQYSQFKPFLKGDVYFGLLQGNSVMTLSTIVIRRFYWDKTQGFDPLLPSCQDWDLYLQLAKLCEFDFVEEPLAKYLFAKSGDQITGNIKSVIAGHK
ncbi:MAG: glycosyltransferase family 2 protein, partial [Candidatus Moranbacteria bacterium]|nr:glycosyltransferase family 2 protein [Candidatus Moranbacteria bacterium]